MYLAKVRVPITGLDRKALFDLLQGNAYGQHRLLWRLFPEETERPFLFRQELEQEEKQHPRSGPARGLPLFYVVSAVAPQSVPGLLDCEYKPFTPQLGHGQRLAFRLRANPVVARLEPGHKRSKRHDVLMNAKKQAQAESKTDPLEIQNRMDAAAQAWLGDPDRSQRHGYQLVTQPAVSGYQQHVYRRKGREIRFSSVDFHGILEIQEPDRFYQTLSDGIGRSKAFGCGMWMIRRVNA